MTRANITLITKYGKFELQCNSSAYPSYLMDDIINFATSAIGKSEGNMFIYDSGTDSGDLSEFIFTLGLTLGSIGNPSYYYIIDFKNGEIKVHNNARRWVTAPSNWKELGWQGLYYDEKGRFGFADWIKGKVIYRVNIIDLVESFKDGVFKLKDSEISRLKNFKESF